MASMLPAIPIELGPHLHYITQDALHRKSLHSCVRQFYNPKIFIVKYSRVFCVCVGPGAHPQFFVSRPGELGSMTALIF